MYAIRSYYDLLEGVEILRNDGYQEIVYREGITLGISNFSRITSYNVCYTKLLRRNFPEGSLLGVLQDLG